MRKAAVLAFLVAALANYAGAQCQGDFLHGVASGDPTADAIILWTRVTPANASDVAQRIRWQVWPEDSEASAPSASGEVLASPEHDFTVKVAVTGILWPRVRYAYSFECGPTKSPQGKFRLPPPASEALEKLEYAILSCARWQSGFFTAYRVAARRELDFWLHLGDFIYEYPEFTDGAVRKGLQPPHETVTLADYRQRFSLHRLDTDLQSLSAVAPLIAVWDDHELANDAWRGGAENHQRETEGNFSDRKVAALRAYHEWMPTRSGAVVATAGARAAGSGDPASWKRWRRFDFGDLASLLLLETRHTGRTTNEGMTWETLTAEMRGLFHAQGDPGPDRWHGSRLEQQLLDLKARVDAYRSSPEKRMLDEEQAAWFAEQAAGVADRGASWRLVAQPLVMREGMTPDFEGAIRTALHSGNVGAGRRWAAILANLTQLNSTVALTGGGVATVTPGLRGAALRKLATGRYRITLNLDSWMGYTAARDRLAQALSAGKPVSTVVYGGDSHNAWAGTVRDSGGRAFAAEFDGMSVSSTGLESWVPWIPSDLQAAGWLAANPDLRWMDPSRRGLMVVRLNRTAHEVQFLAVDVSSQVTSASELLSTFVAEPAGTGCPRVSSIPRGPGRPRVGGGLRPTR